MCAKYIIMIVLLFTTGTTFQDPLNRRSVDEQKE
jgi:hypothetical protein